MYWLLIACLLYLAVFRSKWKMYALIAGGAGLIIIIVLLSSCCCSKELCGACLFVRLEWKLCVAMEAA